MNRDGQIAWWCAWFVVGFALALILQFTVAHAYGDEAALLHVGSGSRYHTAIEQELGNVATFPGIGHDGQTVYLVARDPLARGGTPKLFSVAGYRYRRILLPLLAGLAGHATPRATVIGLALWSAGGFGLGVAALALLTRLLSLRPWPVFGLLANPGYWFSVTLLTSDALAGGLAFSGLALWVSHRRRLALATFAAAALTKEYYLLVPLAIAAWELSKGHRSRALTLITMPALPVAVWSLWVTLATGHGLSPMANLALPGVGIAASAPVWIKHSGFESALSLGLLVALAVSIASTFWKSGQWLRYQVWMWGALAVVSSNAVWSLGNNNNRVLAPVWVFCFLTVESVLSDSGLRSGNQIGTQSE